MAELTQKYETEVSMCRDRVLKYVHGCGLDIGCGPEKITDHAIGIDIKGAAADIHLDLSAKDSLRIFTDDYFDYVFSSHCLEDFYDTEGILKQWWSKIRPGGYLVLYGPDPDYYPRVGEPGANVEHKHDLYWEDVWKIIKGFGNAKQISASRHNEGEEHSWQLVMQKRHSVSEKILNTCCSRNANGGRITFPREKKASKECLVARYSYRGLGSNLWWLSTPVLPLLKEEGYYIVHVCTPYSFNALKENPNIDEFVILQNTDKIPYEDLQGRYWDELGKSFDKVINLTTAVESTLLKIEGTEEFNWPHKRRHKECNKNYMDRAMKAAGFPKLKGKLPELYFTPIEDQVAKNFRGACKDQFLILWSLGGPTVHTLYPWSAYVADKIARNFNDVQIISTSHYEGNGKEIKWHNRCTMNTAGRWTIRQSMIMTKYADLVIGPEDGLLNAAACYDTPKVVFLSHSSQENLTKYWENCTPLYSENCSCYPCHKLIATDCCPRGNVRGVVSECMENLDPDRVYDAVEKYYKMWKAEKKESK